MTYKKIELRLYKVFGLPCSGKTTLSDMVQQELTKKRLHVARLDGDDVRKGICGDLDFSDEGRKENLRRIAEICKLFNRN